MMSNQLRIEFNWLGRDVGSALEKAFYAEIGIAVDEDYLTRLEDLLACTVRSHLRGSVYQLAAWFAANWWRLRWEPEIYDWKKNVDWRMAHSVASIGGGFVWPNVIFASDGDSVVVASRPSESATRIEPVRYLSRTDTRISAAEFEQSVDAFLEAVLSRLHSLGISDERLPALWKEVLQERRDPKIFERRKLEALCGYDPDEAPEEMLYMLLEHGDDLGVSAIEEVAAAGRHSTAGILRDILNLQPPRPPQVATGFRSVLPTLSNLPQPANGERPWQRARRIARFARDHWALGDNPITDLTLAELVKSDPSIFHDRNKAPIPMPLALQVRGTAEHDIYFDSTWSTSRRFAVARIIGDHLHNHEGDRLLPATKAKTSRQQFQRAFAQEFLCPFDVLLAKINTDQPDEDDIREAAEDFGVSPLMVTTTLVNKGELDREALNSVI